jgi:hypothetical protein
MITEETPRQEAANIFEIALAVIKDNQGSLKIQFPHLLGLRPGLTNNDVVVIEAIHDPRNAISGLPATLQDIPVIPAAATPDELLGGLSPLKE